MPLHQFFAVVRWARHVCHRDFGPEEGEKVFRSLSAKEVLLAWPHRHLVLA
jgi:hypothetical protein